MSRTPEQIKSPSGAGPYFEFRIGGFRVTADRVPVRLLATVSSATSGLIAWWLSH